LFKLISKNYRVASLKLNKQLKKDFADSPPPLTDSAEFEAIGKTLAALAVLKAQMNEHRRNRPLDEDRIGGYSA